MPLPVIQDRVPPGQSDLLRLFHRTERHWMGQMAAEQTLDIGAAFTNFALPLVWDANHIREASLPEGLSPAEAMAMADKHFARAGTRCAYWVMNPSAPAGRTAPLEEHLRALGYAEDATDVMYLTHRPPRPAEAQGLMIIPARASFAHARKLAEEGRTGEEGRQRVEARMLRLENPHFDALLAMRGGAAVGTAGVLAVGELGRIEDVHVAEGHRRQGIGRALMGRVLEICLRSLFKHVFLTVQPDNAPAIALYRELGFDKIGQVVQWRAPLNADH